MKLILSVVLVLSVLFACYIEDAYLHFFAPQPGKPAVFTFRAYVPFSFDQAKAFGSKRNLAISQYIPLYSPIPDTVQATKKKMQDLTKRISDFQAVQPDDGRAFSRHLRKELGLEMSDQETARLLGFPNIKSLLEATLTILDSILQSKIVEDPQHIKGKKTAEILYPDPVGTVAYPASDFVTLEEARQTLRTKIAQVFYQVDSSVLEPVIQVALATLSPNLRYDQKENDRRIEEIIRRYPSKLVPYRPGEVMVPFGKALTEEDVLLLAAHHEVEKKSFFETAPWIFFALTFLVALYNLLLSKILQPRLSRRLPTLMFLSLLTLSVLLFKAYLLFTFFPVYSLPFCLLPILLILLERDRVSATWTSLLGAMMASLLSGPTAGVMLLYTLGGLVAILASPLIRKQLHVLVPALLVAVSNAVVVAIFLLDWRMLAAWVLSSEKTIQPLPGTILSSGVLAQVGWAWLGGLASGPAALLVLPLMEQVWHKASAFKLSKYADLQHPLMRDLLTKAPGTYQHTMSVAYLAEVAGDAIGASTLLLRTGAYYHDIGKTADPRFFVENQVGGSNPHDDLGPAESTRIIMDHVKGGLKMARRAGLPDIVMDFIPQHHGTQLVEYFYDKACGEDQANRPRVQDFRYPGPKPQSVEAALLMIVDAVEAASRTLHEPSREKIEAMIRFIIEKRIADGQFDECSLSTRDIAKIIRVLADSLESFFHARVKYPWQKDEP